MIFGKKKNRVVNPSTFFGSSRKKMIDVAELQRRGIVQPPKDDIIIPTNSDGFVDLRASTGSNKKDFFYKRTSSSPTINPNNFSTESDGYSKKEVDSKIIDLDNKIYKIEQRLELLERKAGVSSSENYNGGINW